MNKPVKKTARTRSATAAEAAAHDDPRPVPPPPLDPDACCHSGCAYCVQEAYEDRLDEYRDRLKAWLARHPGQ